MSLSRTTVVALLSGVLIGVLVSLSYTAHARSGFAEKTQADLAFLRASYAAASHDAASNKVIPESAGAVRDCANRPRFEDLLSKLRTLSQSERVELDATFPLCAPYQVLLKKFHLARLERLIVKYKDILSYRAYFIKNSESDDRVVDVMNAYLEKESLRAELMATQVQLQSDIIDVLHGKKIASGKSVDTLAQEGSNLNGKFIALQSEIVVIQKQLSELLGS